MKGNFDIYIKVIDDHQTKSINNSKKVVLSFCPRGIKRQCIPVYVQEWKSKKYGGSRARLALKWQESTRKKYKTDIEEKGPDINLYGNRCIGYQLSRTIYLALMLCLHFGSLGYSLINIKICCLILVYVATE